MGDNLQKQYITRIAVEMISKSYNAFIKIFDRLFSIWQIIWSFDNNGIVIHYFLSVRPLRVQGLWNQNLYFLYSMKFS